LQIELDFEKLYPGNNLSLFTKFEVLKSKILKYVEKCNVKGVDDLVIEIQNPPPSGKFFKII